MKSTSELIVNADDFGISAGVNRGIVEAHLNGIVTSASLMVRWPSAFEAVALSRSTSRLSVGLHIDMGEWAFRGGDWTCLYEVAPVADRFAVECEARRQLDLFRQLTGRDPTHLDSHQHVHRDEPTRGILVALANELSVPLRHYSTRVGYCGAFYGQTARGESLPDAINSASIIRILRDLPPGVTELACHPAADDDLNTMYGRERLAELKTLCAGEVRSAIDDLGIQLRSFHGLAGVPASGGKTAVSGHRQQRVNTCES